MSRGGQPGLARPFSLWAGLLLLLAPMFLPACGQGTISDPRALGGVCVPDCSGKECGDDGCGGSCGVCGAGDFCNGFGTCYHPNTCTPSCDERQCGDDGCGGSCGDCAGEALCNGLGACYQPDACTPSCDGKVCGDGGCGGSCGICTDGDLCNALGTCYDPNACVPDCLDGAKECGGDGCGGSCGSCDGSDRCSGGVCVACVPDCAGKSCGEDGCGGSCGACTGGDVCSAEGTCYDPTPPPPPCVPDCSGKECGNDGCGGSCGTCSPGDTCNSGSGSCMAPPAGVVWTDSIQSGGAPYGFDNMETQRPIDVVVNPSDANGANLSRVPDPAGGPGYAMRHYGLLDNGGARSQLALWSGPFSDLATSGQAVYIAQEWYFPEALSSDTWGWLALWDWHSTGPGWGENRWHAAPTLNLVTDGSMRVELGWGGTAADINGWTGDVSSTGLPVGEWFDIEMRYQWTAGTTTITVWVNGELFLEQSGVQTRDSNHQYVEMYIKLYGSSDSTWSPAPSVKYTRNVRISGERIWR